MKDWLRFFVIMHVARNALAGLTPRRSPKRISSSWLDVWLSIRRSGAKHPEDRLGACSAIHSRAKILFRKLLVVTPARLIAGDRRASHLIWGRHYATARGASSWITAETVSAVTRVSGDVSSRTATSSHTREMRDGFPRLSSKMARTALSSKQPAGIR